jgi:hypothetical protein
VTVRLACAVSPTDPSTALTLRLPASVKIPSGRAVRVQSARGAGVFVAEVHPGDGVASVSLAGAARVAMADQEEVQISLTLPQADLSRDRARRRHECRESIEQPDEAPHAGDSFVLLLPHTPMAPAETRDLLQWLTPLLQGHVRAIWRLDAWTRRDVTPHPWCVPAHAIGEETFPALTSLLRDVRRGRRATFVSLLLDEEAAGIRVYDSGGGAFAAAVARRAARIALHAQVTLPHGAATSDPWPWLVRACPDAAHVALVFGREALRAGAHAAASALSQEFFIRGAIRPLATTPNPPAPPATDPSPDLAAPAPRPRLAPQRRLPPVPRPLRRLFTGR